MENDGEGIYSEWRGRLTGLASGGNDGELFVWGAD